MLSNYNQMFEIFHFEEDLNKEFHSMEALDLTRDTMILREQSFIKEIPLVISGSIKVYKEDENGKEIVLYHILPGQSCILSIASCLNEKESKANAIVEKNTTLIAVPASKVRSWIDKYPSWRKFVHQLYYDRLEEVLSLIDSIAFKQVDVRLLEKLREYQKSQGDIIKSTHQSIANEIGTAREVVSRLLKHLEKTGTIKLDRGEIRIIKTL